MYGVNYIDLVSLVLLPGIYYFDEIARDYTAPNNSWVAGEQDVLNASDSHLDLGHVPYVLYRVKYIGPVSLVAIAGA